MLTQSPACPDDETCLFNTLNIKKTIRKGEGIQVSFFFYFSTTTCVFQAKISSPIAKKVISSILLINLCTASQMRWRPLCAVEKRSLQLIIFYFIKL